MSFTVLAPQLFQPIPSGNILVTTTGTVSAAAGLWIIDVDVVEFKRLVSINAGWIFTIPLMFAASDIYSTLISLSANPGIVELNPFVAAAVQYGSVALVPFLISYFALSQGLALVMLRTGEWLFGESSKAKFLPFSLVCSASAFGPFSNLIGMGIGYGTSLVYLLGAVASAGICSIAFSISANSTGLRITSLNRD